MPCLPCIALAAAAALTAPMAANEQQQMRKKAGGNQAVAERVREQSNAAIGQHKHGEVMCATGKREQQQGKGR